MIDNGRLAYNDSFQNTEKEQLLKNIVRMRFNEPPLVLDIASISTSTELVTNGAADTSVIAPNLGNVFRMSGFGTGVGVEYSENPTVTYTPLKGEAFVKSMLTPVNLTTLALILQSGWSIERVFRVFVERINTVENATTAAGPTPSGPPDFERFREVVDLLRQLQLNRYLALGFTAGDKGVVLTFSFPSGLRDDPRGRRLADILNIRGDPRQLRVTTSHQPGPDEISIHPRSISAAMYFLSQNTDVPEDLVARGLVAVTRYPDGAPFDWNGVLGGLFQIHSAVAAPPDAFAVTRHRGVTYYIDGTDITSQRTFTLFMTVVALQSGNIPSTGPLLTLPVVR